MEKRSAEKKITCASEDETLECAIPAAEGGGGYKVFSNLVASELDEVKLEEDDPPSQMQQPIEEASHSPYWKQRYNAAKNSALVMSETVPAATHPTSALSRILSTPSAAYNNFLGNLSDSFTPMTLSLPDQPVPSPPEIPSTPMRDTATRSDFPVNTLATPNGLKNLLDSIERRNGYLQVSRGSMN